MLHYRKEIEVPADRPIDYIDILDEYHMHDIKMQFYLERPLQTFYGRALDGNVEQLYEIDCIEDLFRFEFIKMIERDIFIKKCKNCGSFLSPCAGSMRNIAIGYITCPPGKIYLGVARNY